MAWVKDLEGFWINSKNITALGIKGPDSDHMYHLVAMLNENKQITVKVFAAESKDSVQKCLDRMILQFSDIVVT
jgi:hypothetical protein